MANIDAGDVADTGEDVGVAPAASGEGHVHRRLSLQVSLLLIDGFAHASST